MSEHINYPVRLQAFLAKAGLGSRRSCEHLITEGRVTINGAVVNQLGVKVDRDDRVTCDGSDVKPFKPVYIMLNKPAGYLTSNYDPHHTHYAVDLIDIRQKSSLFHVGRLDKESSGLIIYTNDGIFAQQISHPSYEVEKEYVVVTDDTGPIRKFSNVLTGKGLDVGGITYRFKSIDIVDKTVMTIILGEGKNREIRNVLTFAGCSIESLHRIRVGSVELGDLPMGAYRHLSEQEIASIRREVHS
jgi:23S rRNA pseudouridine2605 synthase